MRYLLLCVLLFIAACSTAPDKDSEPLAISFEPELAEPTSSDTSSSDASLAESLSSEFSLSEPVSDEAPLQYEEAEEAEEDKESTDPYSSYYSYDDPQDPFEPFNRTMWDFNYEVLDPYLVSPVVHAYNDYVYDGVKEGSNNMVQNLREPSTAVNHFLQLNFEDGLGALMRFLLNSTIGLAGYYDVAGQLGLERRREDFSDVLGKMGVGEGPYVMLPILGPKTVREYVGDTIDTLYFPYAALTLLQDFALWSVDGLYKRHKVIDQEELLRSSIDPYLFVKDAYLQHRKYQFYDGNIPESEQAPEEEIPDEFFDELD